MCVCVGVGVCVEVSTIREMCLLLEMCCIKCLYIIMTYHHFRVCCVMYRLPCSGSWDLKIYAYIIYQRDILYWERSFVGGSNVYTHTHTHTHSLTHTHSHTHTLTCTYITIIFYDLLTVNLHET